MSKIERVDAAIDGAEVDRPPFTVWYHFGDQHTDGRTHAENQFNFYRRYNLDFIKVMNDYEFPRPEGLYDIEKPDDWHRLTTYNPWERREFREELIALKELSRKLSGEAYFVGTIFSPWTIARNISYKVFFSHLEEYSDDVLAGLDLITTNLERLAAAMLEVGASGIFLSVAGATREFGTFKKYEKLGKQFDLRILKAAEGAAFNILHIHGSSIYFRQLLDYPASVLNWADRDSTNPSLKKARSMTQKCLMGGIEHLSFKETFLADVRAQIQDAVSQTGGRKLIIAPGCSIKTNSYEKQILNIYQCLEELAGRFGAEK